MQPESPVDIADRVSRKRAGVIAIAAGVFVAIQVIARPFFVNGSDSQHRTQIDLWAINAAALLLGLATGGGILNSRKLRSLVNDEVSRSNRQTAVAVGYWVAMVIAMGLYFLPASKSITGREAVYIIVSSSIVVALLAFSYLEYRAHRDA